MDSVKSQQQHTKTYLAGNEECHLTFCQRCQIVELHLGALTLRLNPQSLRNLNGVFNQASHRLERLRTLDVQDESEETIRNERVH